MTVSGGWASEQSKDQVTVSIREKRKENIFVQKIHSITDIFEETLVSNQDLTYRQITAGYLFCMRTTVLNKPEAVEIRLKDAILPGIRQAYIISAVFSRYDLTKIYLFEQKIFNDVKRLVRKQNTKIVWNAIANVPVLLWFRV